MVEAAVPTSSVRLRELDHVLVVDDSSVARMVLGNALGRTDIEVETVSSADQALAAIERRRPAVVLTNVDMPECDGFELLAQIKARDSRLPVILISVDTDIEARARAAQLGAAALVRKSAHHAPLVELVHHFVRG